MNPSGRISLLGQSGDEPATNPGAIGSEEVNEVVQGLAAEIASYPFVRGLNPKHLDMLASKGVRCWFDRDQPLLKEDDWANRFYLIQDGKVAVEAFSEEDAPILIQTLGPGDELGWSWLFPKHYFHFGARAIEPTRAVEFFGPALVEFCEQDHDFGYELAMRTAEALTKQLMATREKLVEAYRKL